MGNGKFHPRVKVVLFDAMYTFIVPRENRPKMLKQLLFEEAGVDEHQMVVWIATQWMRNILPASSDYRRDWVTYNQRIISALCWLRKTKALNDLSPKRYSLQVMTGRLQQKLESFKFDPADNQYFDAAKRIQRRILWDTSLYTVREEMKCLFKKLAKSGLRIGIASNQDYAALQLMLKTFAVEEFFSVLFTADRITGMNEVVSKPHERFWQLAQEQLGVEASDIALVGNSMRNDAPARRVGWSVVIYDRCGHQHPIWMALPESEKNLVQFCRTISRIEDALSN